MVMTCKSTIGFECKTREKKIVDEVAAGPHSVTKGDSTAHIFEITARRNPPSVPLARSLKILTSSSMGKMCTASAGTCLNLSIYVYIVLVNSVKMLEREKYHDRTTRTLIPSPPSVYLKHFWGITTP